MPILKLASSKLRTYPLNTVYNNRALTVTENIKFLGMHLDCNLTWKSHVDNLIKKPELHLLHVEKIITLCKYKNITFVFFFAHFYSQIC
jgi:hypothetical protein